MLEKLTEKTPSKTPTKANKRSKFVELANSRTRTAIKAIRIIGKLGNKNAYEYSDADVKKIVSVLTKEIDAMKARMSHSGGRDVVDFSLE